MPCRGLGQLTAGAALLAVVATACGAPDPAPPRVPGIAPSYAPLTVPPMTVEAQDAVALRFTNIVLPAAGATVLGSHVYGEPRDLHVVVVEIDPDRVDELLARSGFERELILGRRVRFPAVPGYPTGTGERIASGQDIPSQSVNREVLVDRTDPDRPRVFAWAYRTE